MNVIGVIPARFSSARFAGKVLADLLGKPVVQHVWENAKKAKMLDDLIVATDDERVLKAATDFGAKAIHTSPDQPSGSDRLIEVINPLDVKVIVNIQGDEPLIHPSMIDAAAQALLDDKHVFMATIMKMIDDPHQVADPHVVKVIVDKNNFALYFSRAAIPFPAPNSDVRNPVFYKHIGLYAYTKDFLFTYKKLPLSHLEKTECLEQLRVLEAGFKIKVIETKYDTIGVDTLEDLERLKAYLGKEKT